MTFSITPEHKRLRSIAMGLNARYGFGARIISRILMVDESVQIPYYRVAAWVKLGNGKLYGDNPISELKK